MSLVRMLWRSIVGLPVIAFVFALTPAPNAGAVVIYDFVGNCTRFCTGQAEAVLTLADTYTPGTVVQKADFISFTYMSSSSSYEIPKDSGFDDFVGFHDNILPVPPLDQAGIFIDFAGSPSFFDTNPAGGWRSNSVPLRSGDQGTGYSWTLRTTAVPEPATALLFLAGLGLLIGLRRRTAATRA